MYKAYKERATLGAAETKRLSFWRRGRRLDYLYLGYGIFILLTVLVSYFCGLFNYLPYDPEELDLSLIMAPPGTDGHWLGTDFLGRDIATRVILGTQAYFLPGLLAITIALSFGAVLGIIAGYRGGYADVIVTYISNLLDSFPRLVLILFIVALFKPDITYIMIVVGITNIPVVSSMIKSKILMLKQQNFIESAIATGMPTKTIIVKHVLWYHCRALLIINATLGMGEAILIESSLSYLGFGVQEPTPSWGNMVQAGANYLMQGNFWTSTAPALAILFTVLGFNLLGDGLTNLLEGKKR